MTTVDVIHGRHPATVRILEALDARVAAASEVALGPDLLEAVGSVDADLRETPGVRAAVLLPALVRRAVKGDDLDILWLAFVAVVARFPTTDEMVELLRLARLGDLDGTEKWLLDVALASCGPYMDRGMTVVSDATVVEVDFSAKHDLHTGIHRVVRETVPRWAADHPVVLTAWSDDHRGLRRLTLREEARVLDFGSAPAAEGVAEPDEDAATDEDATTVDPTVPALVVPWRTRILLPDVPQPVTADPLAAMARWGGVQVCLIGYDLIPITSADKRPLGEANGTAAFLALVKHATRVAGISTSATAEFRGFRQSLPAQGLRGPVVSEVNLPSAADPLPPSGPPPAAPDHPVVLCTGTREPHKNHRALLHAAERLWREGLRFEMRFVGGKGWSDDAFAAAADALTAQGRPLALLGRVSEQELWDQLRHADVVAFCSLHEGYGLPVAEALSVGTPVLTTRYGSQAEIAAGGGCLTVDPRDDDDITNGLRRLVSEPELRSRLAGEAAARKDRTWDDYASDLWRFFSEPGEDA